MVKKFLLQYSLDVRSLSLMRIGVALVALYDLIIRFTDLEAHYTNAGVLPIGLLQEQLWNENWFSFYTIGTSTTIVATLMLLHGASIITLFLGYKTKIFTIIVWLFTISIQNRNPLIGQGGDDLLRLILFWGIFLPWGAFFSIDAKRNQNIYPYNITNIAGFGYLVLIFSMYFFSALLKNGSDWVIDHQALYYVLNLDMLVLPLGKYLLNYPHLCKVLSISVYYYELLMPFLLLIPFWVANLRLVFIVCTFLLHIGFASTLYIGIFPFVAVVVLVGLLPSYVWKASLADQKWQKENVYVLYAKNIFLAIVISFGLYTNSWYISSHYIVYAEKLRTISLLLRLDQCWGMFAPIVFRDDGWFIFKSTIKDKEVDLYRSGNLVDFRKPTSVVSLVKNDRWRKYQECILFIHNSYLRTKYCEWIIKDWNNSHPDSMRVSKVELIYMKETTLAFPQKMIVKQEELSKL